MLALPPTRRERGKRKKRVQRVHRRISYYLRGKWSFNGSRCVYMETNVCQSRCRIIVFAKRTLECQHMIQNNWPTGYRVNSSNRRATTVGQPFAINYAFPNRIIPSSNLRVETFASTLHLARRRFASHKNSNFNV